MSSEHATPDEHRGIWVFIEQKHKQFARVSLELLGRARTLAVKLGVEVTAIFVGEGVVNQAEALFAYGADRVIIADDPLAKDYRTEVYTAVIADQALKEKPEILLFGGTCTGRDLAPRVAGRLHTGCITDCTRLDIDQEMRLIVASKPYFGRNLMADIICPNHQPQIVTVRPGIMELPEQDKTRKGELVYAPIKLKEEDVKVKVLDTVRSTANGSSLEEAERVIAGGGGVGNAEGFILLRELAALLGAELGATSLPVDAGWISPDRKIGQTGKTVRPRLYIGCGISGAIQHAAGMINSELIVAINKDPNAEIFGFADYGIVGDLHKIVPALIDELKRNQANEFAH